MSPVQLLPAPHKARCFSAGFFVSTFGIRPFRALKMRPVRQGAVHSLWSRLFCGPLKCVAYHRSLFLAPSSFEDASRTGGGCFWHRISLPYRRSLFFTPNASENASRTPGSLFEHGTHVPYHRWPSPVPNARHRGRLPPQRSLANKKRGRSQYVPCAL